MVNSRGYPIRSSEPDCTFWLRKGWCAFGVTCKYNHPDLPTPAAAQQAGPFIMHAAGSPHGMLMPYTYAYPGAMMPMHQGFLPRMVPVTHGMCLSPPAAQQHSMAALATQMGGMSLAGPFMPMAGPLMAPVVTSAMPVHNTGTSRQQQDQQQYSKQLSSSSSNSGRSSSAKHSMGSSSTSDSFSRRTQAAKTGYQHLNSSTTPSNHYHQQQGHGPYASERRNSFGPAKRHTVYRTGAGGPVQTLA